jgi:hypothetical protein
MKMRVPGFLVPTMLHEDCRSPLEVALIHDELPYVFGRGLVTGGGVAYFDAYN